MRNFIFERTTDLELVRSIITHPKIYDHVSDDGCPPADQFKPLDNPVIWYVLVVECEVLLGMWTFMPQNTACWEVHTCLLPVAWGDLGREAAKAMAEWIWKNTPCRRLVTNVPVMNRMALKFAKAAGMEEYGVNPKSYLKRGTLHDQILLGMSKPEDN